MFDFMLNLLCRDTRTANQQATDGHIGITDAELSGMSNGELALWQSNHPNEPSKLILAEQEWQNRRLARQIKAGYKVSLIGIVGTLVGTLAGVGLGWYLSEPPKFAPSHDQAIGERDGGRNQLKNQTKTESIPSLITTTQTPIPQPTPHKDSANAKQKQPNGNRQP